MFEVIRKSDNVKLSQKKALKDAIAVVYRLEDMAISHGDYEKGQYSVRCADTGEVLEVGHAF